MVATVFLVCVCYVQHAYQRTPRCCRWITGRSEEPAADAASTGTAASAGGHGGPGAPGHMHRHVEAVPDQPPAYDDFRKYHRPCSFGRADRQPAAPPAAAPPRPPVPVPPCYTDAVQSLRRKEEEEERARARFRAHQQLPHQPRRTPVRRSLSCGASRRAANQPPLPPTGVDNRAYLREENAPPAFTEVAAPSADHLSIEVDLGDGAATMTRDTRASNC